MRFWGGFTKSTPTTVGSRLQKKKCENVPMSAPNDVVNIKTCLGNVESPPVCACEGAETHEIFLPENFIGDMRDLLEQNCGNIQVPEKSYIYDDLVSAVAISLTSLEKCVCQ